MNGQIFTGGGGASNNTNPTMPAMPTNPAAPAKPMPDTPAGGTPTKPPVEAEGEAAAGGALKAKKPAVAVAADEV